MTLDELINRIQLVASQTNPTGSPPLLDLNVLTEVVLPRVFSIVTTNAVKDENQLSALRKEHILTFVAGKVALPESVKDEFIESGFFVDTANGYSNASFKPQYYEFASTANNFCPLFAVQNRQLHYRQSGTAAGLFAGNLTFNVITLPTLPDAISDTVDVTDNILQQIISTAASIVNGQIPLAQVGLDYLAGGK